MRHDCSLNMGATSLPLHLTSRITSQISDSRSDNNSGGCKQPTFYLLDCSIHLASISLAKRKPRFVMFNITAYLQHPLNEELILS